MAGLVAAIVGVIGAPTCIVAVLDVSEQPLTVTIALYVPAVVALVVLAVWPESILPLSIHTYDPPAGVAVSVWLPLLHISVEPAGVIAALGIWLTVTVVGADVAAPHPLLVVTV